jgi:hypothetical protein
LKWELDDADDLPTFDVGGTKAYRPGEVPKTPAAFQGNRRRLSAPSNKTPFRLRLALLILQTQ